MINLNELKQQIEQNKLTHHLIIFKCAKGSEFIPYQYAHEFCKNNDVNVFYPDDVSQLPRNTLFGESIQHDLTMYYVDNLTEDLNVDAEEIATNYIWVICNKINKKCQELYNDNIVEVTKLLDWQIKDFITSRCPDLKDNQVNELFDYYKDDLFRLDNELCKIELLGSKKYNYLRNQLFVDISNFNIFDIVNCIIRRDRRGISNIYEQIDCIDVEPFGLLTLLINNFRQVIDIQLAKNATAESVGVSSKQFWAIQKYSCGYYNRQELIYIYELLTSIDYKVKSGEISTDLILDYIICKILTL